MGLKCQNTILFDMKNNVYCMLKIANKALHIIIIKKYYYYEQTTAILFCNI